MLGSKFLTIAGTQSVRLSSGKLKELGIRRRAVTNIQKIVKTMKMISAAKYAQAEKGILPARSYKEAGAGAINALSSKEGYKAPEGNHLVIICSSDRGLCGALHTNLGRAGMEVGKQFPGAKYVCVGDKARLVLTAAGLQDDILFSVKEVGRNNPTFGDAALVAREILERDFEWASGTILYNHHKSAMTQVITEQGVSSTAGFEAMPGIELYDSVDADVIQSFTEFALASTLFGCIKEGYASEQAARMVSMDGASKNAGEMIEKMQLQYNRMRQAVITTELCEIIAGVAALE